MVRILTGYENFTVLLPKIVCYIDYGQQVL
jgi:hypothetical protein